MERKLGKAPDHKADDKKLENMKFDTSGYIYLTPISELIRRVEAAKR